MAVDGAFRFHRRRALVFFQQFGFHGERAARFDKIGIFDVAGFTEHHDAMGKIFGVTYQPGTRLGHGL